MTPDLRAALFARFWGQAPLVVKAVAALFSVLAGVVAGQIGASNFPDVRPAEGATAEARIASVFALQEDADPVLRGDLLIERFYVVNVDTGETGVAKLCKGRVLDIHVSVRPDGNGAYMVSVDRQGLAREQDRIASFVEGVEVDSYQAARNLGLRIESGATEQVRLNFDTLLPRERSEFRGPKGESIFAFLENERRQPWLGARLINIEGTNYLLSSTDVFPAFRGIFGVERALFISELVFVDSTSVEEAERYRHLAERIPARP
jgi:hypothetical protein